MALRPLRYGKTTAAPLSGAQAHIKLTSCGDDMKQCRSTSVNDTWTRKNKKRTRTTKRKPKLESYMDHRGSIRNIGHPFNEVLPEKSGQILLKKAAPHFPWPLPSAVCLRARNGDRHEASRTLSVSNTAASTRAKAK